MTGYRLPRTPSAAVRMQKEIAGKVVARDDFSGKIELVCGVDVSYRQGVAHCSAAVTDLSFNMVEQASTTSQVTRPAHVKAHKAL